MTQRLLSIQQRDFHKRKKMGSGVDRRGLKKEIDMRGNESLRKKERDDKKRRQKESDTL